MQEPGHMKADKRKPVLDFHIKSRKRFSDRLIWLARVVIFSGLDSKGALITY